MQKTLTRCICEPILYTQNQKQALKKRTQTINKLKKEHPNSRITYDNGFIMCEYMEGVGVN